MNVSSSYNQCTDVCNRQWDSRRLSNLLLIVSMLIVMGTLIFAGLSATQLVGWRTVATGGSALRYLPMLAIFLAAMMGALSISPSQFVYNVIASLRVNWYLTGFALVSLPGAMYARFIIKQETSFFSRAFPLLSFFGAYFIFLLIPDKYWPQLRLWIFRTLGYLVVISAIVVSLSILLSGSATAVRLTNIAGSSRPATVLLLTQGLAVVFYSKSKATRTVLFSLLVVLTVLTFKNTAVLILLSICVGLYLLPKGRLRKFSITNIIVLGAVGVLLLLLVGGAYLLVQARYSDGHTAFRSQLYKYQVQQFLISPLYGELFTAETRVWFGQVPVPTHSDWLDVLAQGGLVGITLFTGAFAYTGCLLIETRRRTIQSDTVTSQLASYLLLFLVATIISFLFNPILGTPDIALMIWVTLAFAHRVAKPVRLSQTTEHKKSSL